MPLRALLPSRAGIAPDARSGIETRSPFTRRDATHLRDKIEGQN
jgi:hypothetical protein